MRNLRLDHIDINKFSKLKRYTKVSNYLKSQKLFHKYDYSSFFISFKSEQSYKVVTMAKMLQEHKLKCD